MKDFEGSWPRDEVGPNARTARLLTVSAAKILNLRKRDSDATRQSILAKLKTL